MNKADKATVIMCMLWMIMLSGCSFGDISNRVGRADGMTSEHIETSAPASEKTIVIKRVGNEYVIIKGGK